MAEVPAWKQDVEFMARIVQAQQLGSQDNCVVPLPEGVLTRSARRAYDFALMRLGDGMAIDGQASLWNEQNIRRDMHNRYYVPEQLGAHIMQLAVTDMTQIQELHAQW